MEAKCELWEGKQENCRGASAVHAGAPRRHSTIHLPKNPHPFLILLYPSRACADGHNSLDMIEINLPLSGVG
jgi:hypothetical protein